MTKPPRHPNSRIDAWRNPPPNAAAARRRRQRLEEGVAQRMAEAAAWPGRRRTVTHNQLMVPLLQLLAEHERVRPMEVYDELALRFDLDEVSRLASVTYRDGQTTNLFERTVRWTMQEAKRLEFAANHERGVWRATGKGLDTLGLVQPGLLLTVFHTEQGRAVAAWAEEAAAVIEPGSVDLLFTSPLFPLLKGKSYGSMTPAEWLPWMTDMLAIWKDLLTDRGSMVIHLGDVHYRGLPSFSSYMERFVLAAQDDVGLHKMQTFYWSNPSRQPETEHAAKRRMLVRNSTEPLYWLSKVPFPKADNGKVLVPYTEGTIRTKLGRKGGKVVRPAGYDMADSNWSKDNGGSIPGNLIVAPNAGGNDAYRRRCREQGLIPHPAPMPAKVVEFFVDYMTDPGDLVADVFGGSCMTGAVAEKKGRRWICLDRSRTLLRGAGLRPEFGLNPTR